MTKKHFIALAAAIKTKFQLDRPWADIPLTVQCSALDAAQVVIGVAKEFNPKFDEKRFRVACGVWVN